MIIELSPTLISWLLISGASVCAFMIGFLFAHSTRDQIIEATIMYLIDDGYLQARTDQDGDIELIPIDKNDS